MNGSLKFLEGWVSEQIDTEIVWFVKFLSADDTRANNPRQTGPCIPKQFLFAVFPSLNKPEVRNPRVRINLTIDSHNDARIAEAIWYNSKLHGNPKGGRNETRIADLGGTASPLLDPENTGGLVAFTFRRDASGKFCQCRVWICEGESEMNAIQDFVGVVEPDYPATRFAIYKDPFD